jgi:toxin ParE1/3/4
MSQLVFTSLAQHDLDGILSYISEHRPATAVEVVRQIREKCELLAVHPGIGQRRREIAHNCRSFPFKRWVLFYRVTGDRVEILRVVDGSRDLESLFD